MKIFTLDAFTSQEFKNAGYDYDITLTKYQVLIIDDVVGQFLIDNNKAKLHEGEKYISGVIYDPVNNPYNPTGDMPQCEDYAADFPLNQSDESDDK